MLAIHFLLVPRTYDQSPYAELIAPLGAAGVAVSVHPLPGRHPPTDSRTVLAADITVAHLPDNALVMAEALALPVIAGSLWLDSHRLRLVALVDRLLHTASGLPARQADLLRRLEQGALSRMRRVLVADAGLAGTVAALGVPSDRIILLPPVGPERVADLLRELERITA
ncbi:MAG TPA: glycosyl transferase [Azospirillaceae bacterium]|nr:glycosyl transferase [Azospirillaceae bacterium]